MLASIELGMQGCMEDGIIINQLTSLIYMLFTIIKITAVNVAVSVLRSLLVQCEL